MGNQAEETQRPTSVTGCGSDGSGLGQVCGQAQGFPKSRSQTRETGGLGWELLQDASTQGGLGLSCPCPLPGRVRELGIEAMWAASLPPSTPVKWEHRSYLLRSQ